MNLETIPTFGSSDLFHVVVESPRGSSLKLKYEPVWEAMIAFAKSLRVDVKRARKEATAAERAAQNKAA